MFNREDDDDLMDDIEETGDDFPDDPDLEDLLDSDQDLIDGVGFADPGGRSALRAATPNNPRIHPCPTCGQPNRLTPLDVARGYQCDDCADRDEGEYRCGPSVARNAAIASTRSRRFGQRSAGSAG